jgi:Flp pilus assembly CpaF family ATPase
MAQSYRHPNVSDTDINILLLGSTGDGMTTFINAFINYLAYDTLDIALKHELKVLIPTSFITFDEST